MSYLRVCEDIGGKPVELPAEDDDTLPLSTLQAQFPEAVGLRYLPDPDGDIFRGIRCLNGRLLPPKEGWEDLTLYCTYPPGTDKRKVKEDDWSRDGMEAAPPSSKKACREVKCSDLIVLGLHFKTTEDSLKKYFEEKFGPLLMALVKTDLYTKRSKGFGFIRFTKYEDQVKALSARKHEIDGRWVTIKPPFAKDGVESSLPSKVFVSRLTPDMSGDDLKEYFSKYGEVADVFFPRAPFRGFAFLTFLSPESADQAVDEEPHIINGASISVVPATDQQKKSYDDGGSGRGYPSYRGSSYRGSSRGRGSSSRWPGSSSRDSYSGSSRGSRGYDSHDNGSSEDLSKVLAAALVKNPNVVSNLLSNLGSGSGKGGGSMAMRGDYDMDYNMSNNDDYNNYSYTDKSYNPYDDGKGYSSSKYKSSGNSSRY